MDCDNGEEGAIQAQAEEGYPNKSTLPIHNTYQDTLMNGQVLACYGSWNRGAETFLEVAVSPYA